MGPTASGIGSPSEFTVFAVEFYAAVADPKVFLQIFPVQDGFFPSMTLEHSWGQPA
jgi:hypothetical protein